jgi:thioredoxin-dependent peroxiredoxin
VIDVGTAAPDFELTADDGSTVRLSDLRGRPVVLYFYPRDDTPGCTKQACGFRDVYADFQARGAVVLGISTDGQASHERFKAKYGLPFTLLSDVDHAVAERYGVWVEKSSYGRTSMGIKRSTFVLDADGNVVDAGYGVKPETDARRVLEALPA